MVNLSAILGSLILYLFLLHTYESDAARLQEMLGEERKLMDRFRDKTELNKPNVANDEEKAAADSSLLQTAKEQEL